MALAEANQCLGRSSHRPERMTARNVDAPDVKSPIQDNAIRRLILSGVLLITAIAVMTAMMVGSFRERALNTIERQLDNTVLLLANHFDQQFEEFEVVQKDIVAYIRSIRVSSGEEFNHRLSSQEMREILQSKSSGSPDVAEINIFDSDGTLINSSVWPRPATNISDRAYFKAAKSGSASAPGSIELVRSRLVGATWIALISYRINGPDGEFLGVLTRGIPIASFEKFFAPLAIGDDAVVSMFHRDGTMMARYPHLEERIGKNFSNGPFFRILSNTDHGSARKKDVADGRDRIGSVRRLNEFPIVIVATTSVSAALADWRDQTRLLIAVASLLGACDRRHAVPDRQATVAAASTGETASRYRRQQHDAGPAVVQLVGGGLVICNQRYIEMFGVSPDIVKPGCSVHDLLLHRKETGTFFGDVDETCSVLSQKMSLGEAFQRISRSPDGRTIQILYQPLSDGGWVANPRRRHRTPAYRGADRPSGALRRADRPAEPGAVPRTARSRARHGSNPANNWRCSTSTSTSSRASTTRSGI